MKFLKWLLIGVGLALSCFIIVSLFWVADKTGDVRSLQEFPAQPKEVAAEGSLSKTVLAVNDFAHLWITVRNRSDATISTLMVSLDTPGLQVDKLCWYEVKGGSNQCASPQNATIPQLVKDQSVVLWGEAKAVKENDKQLCYATVSWTNSNGVRSAIAIPIGGDVIETPWERVSHAAREFLKDFALPLILLALGAYVGQLDKEREAARQKADNLREAERRAYEAEMQQNHLTWNKMLPVTYKLAVRYHMKIQGALRGFLGEMEKVPNNQSDQQKLRALYFLVLFRRRMKDFLDKNSGFYFKNRDAEDLVVEVDLRYRSLFFGDNEKAKRPFARIVAAASVNESFDAFAARSKIGSAPGDNASEDFQTVWQHFNDWLRLANCPLALLQLKAFDLILGFELNRPYAYWYGWKSTKQDWEKNKRALEEIAGKLEKEETEARVARAIRAYLQGGEPQPVESLPVDT